MLKVDRRKAPEADIESGSDWKSPRSLLPNSAIDNKTWKQVLIPGLKTQTRGWETGDAQQLFTESLCGKDLAEQVGVFQTRLIVKKTSMSDKSIKGNQLTESCATLIKLLQNKALHQPEQKYTFLLDGEIETARSLLLLAIGRENETALGLAGYLTPLEIPME